MQGHMDVKNCTQVFGVSQQGQLPITKSICSCRNYAEESS
jgi:hypothetical protein